MSLPTSPSSTVSLNVVPARTGITWVKLGFKTFFKQPLALGGLVFMNFGLSQLMLMLPFVGIFIAIVLIPSFNLGLLAASRLASEGTFPMPKTLFEAFRFGPEKTKPLLQLGGIYILGIMAVTAVFLIFFGFQPDAIDANDPAALTKILAKEEFLTAIAAALVLYIPLAIAFWHAPALVFWHGVKPVKALFFSTVACFRNLGAMLVYFFMWFAVFMAGMLLSSLVVAATGSESSAAFVTIPIALTIATMFFCSIYFTFQDSFILNNKDNIDLADVNKQ
jgi:hypothetical protein